VHICLIHLFRVTHAEPLQVLTPAMGILFQRLSFLLLLVAAANAGNSSWGRIQSNSSQQVSFNVCQSYSLPITPSDCSLRTSRRSFRQVSTRTSTIGPYSRVTSAKCPPCFNCLLPAFNCGQYGECDPYNGQCKCPAGWGGIDCLTPRTFALKFGRLVLTVHALQNVTHWRRDHIGDCERTENRVNVKKDGVVSTVTVRLLFKTTSDM